MSASLLTIPRFFDGTAASVDRQTERAGEALAQAWLRGETLGELGTLDTVPQGELLNIGNAPDKPGKKRWWISSAAQPMSVASAIIEAQRPEQYADALADLIAFMKSRAWGALGLMLGAHYTFAHAYMLEHRVEAAVRWLPVLVGYRYQAHEGLPPFQQAAPVLDATALLESVFGELLDAWDQLAAGSVTERLEYAVARMMDADHTTLSEVVSTRLVAMRGQLIRDGRIDSRFTDASVRAAVSAAPQNVLEQARSASFAALLSVLDGAKP